MPEAESMKNEGFAAHRAACSGLFCLFCLLAVALGLAGARPLSLAMGGSLLSLFFFTRESLRDALGAFLEPLAIVVDLALLFSAMSLTGGAGSPYALLLPAGLALAWFQLGRGAAWVFAAGSLLGVAALRILGGGRRRACSPPGGGGALHARARAAVGARTALSPAPLGARGARAPRGARSRAQVARVRGGRGKVGAGRALRRRPAPSRRSKPRASRPCPRRKRQVSRWKRLRPLRHLPPATATRRSSTTCGRLFR